MTKPATPQSAWEIPSVAPAGLHKPRRHPASAPLFPLQRASAPPRALLIEREIALQPEPAVRRKIWDLDISLHCSVIGTCLSTGELRALIGKFHPAAREKPSDHDVHTVAVGSVRQRSLLAKQIEKTLDRRHAATIRHFAAAKNADELRLLWKEARQNGDIPGAYWAVLSHPHAHEALVREAFGDVHMLSHLVGAANRADIRRLHQLEEEKSALEEKAARQQAQLREAIVSRDAKIGELRDALAAQIERGSEAARATRLKPDTELATLHALVADLRKLLDHEIRRRERAEKRVEDLAALNGRNERARAALEEEAAALKAEIDAVERALAGAGSEREAGPDRETDDVLDLGALTILYVGGRPQQIAQLRLLVERAGGQLVHHDGGIEDRPDLLAGLVSRASAAFFPVDCISHRAALTLKRLCQQAGKPYIPLRSAGLASMVRALRSTGLASAGRSAAE